MNTLKLIKNALLAAGIAALLSLPILGIRLSMTATSTEIEWRLWWVVSVAALVFIGQMVLPIVSHCCARITLPQPSSRLQQRLMMLLLLSALIWPWWVSRGTLSISTLALIYIILGLGLNIVVGYAGLLVLGYAAFYAVGAYTYALLSQFYGWSFWICLPLAGGFAALAGLLLGMPVLRLRGDYLAIVTLGFGEIMRLMLNNANSLTGGPDGINSIPKPSVFGLPMQRAVPVDGTTFHQFFGMTYNSMHMVIFLYLIALALVLFTLFVTYRLQRMPIGRAWEALREDEIACRSLGLNPARIKLSALVLSAIFAGLAGAFYAARQGSITPDSFGFLESAMMLAIVVLGGMGSTLGVLIAAVVITVLNNAQFLTEYRMLIFGLMLVVMMLWRPQGLLPAQRPQLELNR